MVATTDNSEQGMVSVGLEERFLKVEWADGFAGNYHYMWLRDNCPQSSQLSTRQRVVETADIPADVCASEATVDEGQLKIRWAHDNHVSTFESDWLRSRCYSSPHEREMEWPLELWRAEDLDALPEMNFEEVAEGGDALRRWLTLMQTYGFALLRGVPNESAQVVRVASLFAYAKRTAWSEGREYYDIKLDPSIDHLGYTPSPLRLHTDDSSFEPVPTNFLIHCLVADTRGGESVLADGFRIAEDLRAKEPEIFRLLTSTLLTFSYQDKVRDFTSDAPVISLNERGEVVAVRYSNHIVQPFNLPFDQMEAYYNAYRTFARMRSSAEYQIRFRMAPGDLYMVDNVRVLHGRDGFSSLGNRLLQGCYVDRGDVLSKLRLLSRAGGAL